MHKIELITPDAVTSGNEAAGRVGDLIDSMWALAAIGVALQSGTLAGDPLPVDDPLVDVLAEVGLVVETADGRMVAPGLRALMELTGVDSQAEELAANVRQVSRVLGLSGNPAGLGWAGQDDESLLAQGRASMGMVGPLEGFVIPELKGLGERLGRPGSRFLDVGVGVAGLAIAMCERFPALCVVGVDVMAHVLELARAQVAAHGLDDRIELRHLDVAGLADTAGYDLAWLPGPFVSPPSLRSALPRLHAALRPGGWLLLTMERLEGASLTVAVTLWRTALMGGTVMPPTRAITELFEAGFSEVIPIPTPSSAPVILAAQKAEVNPVPR